jgi:hypothetical protein
MRLKPAVGKAPSLRVPAALSPLSNLRAYRSLDCSSGTVSDHENAGHLLLSAPALNLVISRSSDEHTAVPFVPLRMFCFLLNTVTGRHAHHIDLLAAQ